MKIPLSFKMQIWFVENFSLIVDFKISFLIEFLTAFKSVSQTAKSTDFLLVPLETIIYAGVLLW